MTDVQTTEPPQFTAQYWEKVKRTTFKDTILSTSSPRDGWKEIKLASGGVLRRESAKVTQLLIAGTVVHVETINRQFVTGLFLPDIRAWAFRMTAQEIADYTRELAEAVGEREAKARESMMAHVAAAVEKSLTNLLDALGLDGMMDDETRSGLAVSLAYSAVNALEQGPNQNTAPRVES